MLKSALTNAEKGDAYAREFKCLTRRAQKLICTLWSSDVSYGKRSLVIQHIKTERHKNKQQQSDRQTLLSNCPQTNYFAIHFCNAFLSANIPMEKLGNTQLKTPRKLHQKCHNRHYSSTRREFAIMGYCEIA